MSLKICTSEFLMSDGNGIGVRRSWLPRVVMEQYLQATKDGEIQISPDPVTTIQGSMTWYNNTGDPQDIWMLVHRAPRNIIAQSPTTIIITDGWSFQIGDLPQADYPSINQDTFGGRMQIDRPSVAPDNLLYGRYFLNGDDTTSYVHVGIVPAEKMFQFRYLAGVQTPGAWIVPTQFTPRWEAYAYWARLVALATPAVDTPVVTL